MNCLKLAQDKSAVNGNILPNVNTVIFYNCVRSVQTEI